jgi:hypothetical protein
MCFYTPCCVYDTQLPMRGIGWKIQLNMGKFCVLYYFIIFHSHKKLEKVLEIEVKRTLNEDKLHSKLN